MVSLFRSWGNSIKLLQLNSLKEWGLLTLKGSIGTYQLLFKYFWWLLGIIGVLTYLSIHYKYYIFLLPYSFLVMTVWFFCSLLAARPSVLRKDFNYFLGYWAYGLAALCIILIIGAVWFAIGVGWYQLLWPIILQSPFSGIWYDSYVSRYMAYFMYFALFLVKPVLFSLFFLCDAHLSISAILKSIWSGIKLLWYLLPLCIVIGLVLKSIDVLMRYLVYDSFIYVLLFVLLFPIYLNILIYLYLKERYQHPERYS